MEESTLQGHVKDVIQALERQNIFVNEEDVREGLLLMLKQAGESRTNINRAKLFLVKSKGGDPEYLWKPVERKLGEIDLEDRYVNIKAAVITGWNEAISPEGRRRYFGRLMDETGSISFVMFKGLEKPLKRGDTITITNAQVREGRDGKPQLVIGDRCSVELDRLGTLDDLELPPEGPIEMTIGEVREELPDIAVKGRVIESGKKEISFSEGVKTVTVGRIADPTGAISFTDWTNREFPVGSLVSIKRGYTRIYRGNIDLNMTEKTEVEFLPEEEKFPSLEKLKDMKNSEASFPRLPIAELKTGLRNFSLEVQVMSARKNTINTRSGQREIVEGYLADDSGIVKYTSWADFPYKEGDNIRLKNVYLREYGGKLDVNIGEGAAVEIIEEGDISPVEFHPPEDEVIRTPTRLTVKMLTPKYQNVEISGRLLELNQRTITTHTGEKKVVKEGVFADETGKVALSVWGDQELEANKCYLFRHAYVKSFKGVPQLQIGDKTEVETLKDDTFGPRAILSETRLMDIAEIPSEGGAMDVLIRGVVLEVRPGSGLIDRCPMCQRLLRNGICAVHKEVEGQLDLRTKAILDDGTGAVNLVLNKDMTEKILGMTIEECQEIAKKKLSREPILKRLEDRLIAYFWEVRGDVNSDDYGFQLIATDINPVHLSVKEKAREMLTMLVEGGA